MKKEELRALCEFFDAKNYHELAGKILVSYQTISSWSQGRRTPHPLTIKRIEAMKEAYSAAKKRRR